MCYAVIVVSYLFASTGFLKLNKNKIKPARIHYAHTRTALTHAARMRYLRR